MIQTADRQVESVLENVYCTLFNITYLTRGLALYRSMERCIPDFRLYILAMDEETERILSKLQLEKATVIKRDSVVDGRFKEILDQRSGASLFWTCTPLIIEYILARRNEEWCTYIDADCFFFGDPHNEFTIMKDGDYSVGIVEHRFRRDGSYNRHIESDGRFNVAFNVFRNEENSLKILREWKDQCIEQCTNKPEEGFFGDQLYLNEWPDKYEGVYIVENEGIDVAPWNVNNYHVTKRDGDYCIKNEGVFEKVLMYHFHTLNSVTRHIVSLNLWNTKKRSEIRDLFDLYKDYISECRKQQRVVDGYINCAAPSSHVGITDKIKGFYIKYRNRKENGIIQMLRNIMWI